MLQPSKIGITSYALICKRNVWIFLEKKLRCHLSFSLYGLIIHGRKELQTPTCFLLSIILQLLFETKQLKMKTIQGYKLPSLSLNNEWKLFLIYITVALISSCRPIYLNAMCNREIALYIYHILIIVSITTCHLYTQIRKIGILIVCMNITLDRNLEFDRIRSISWCTKKHSSVYAKYAHIWCRNCSFYVQGVYELNGSLVCSQAYQLICYAVI